MYSSQLPSYALPPLACLQAALAAQELGSFTAAAEALGTTHATVSRRVAAAERWAGVPLFERHGRGVRTTADGDRLLTRLASMLGSIAALAQREPSRGRKAVRIAVTPSFARFWLLPRLSILEAADLRIEILAEQRNLDLRSGVTSIAVRHGRGGWKLGTEAPLVEGRLVPVATEEIARSVGASPDKVLDHPLLHDADRTAWRAWFETIGRPFPTRARDRILFNYAATLDAAVHGVGIALLDEGLHREGCPPGLTALSVPAVELAPLRHILIVADDATEAERALAVRLRSVMGT